MAQKNSKSGVKKARIRLDINGKKGKFTKSAVVRAVNDYIAQQGVTTVKSRSNREVIDLVNENLKVTVNGVFVRVSCTINGNEAWDQLKLKDVYSESEVLAVLTKIVKDSGLVTSDDLEDASDKSEDANEASEAESDEFDEFA